MNSKKLGVLLVLALAILALAWWQAVQRSHGHSLHSGQVMLPGLRESINDVTGLVIRKGENQVVSIRLTNGSWQVEEKQGYPADAGRLRSALLILADAKVLEEKTSRPDMYARLGVEDPDGPNAQGLYITVESGENRRGLIIGKPAMGDSQYVRRSNEAPSLLVNQALSMEADAMKWVQTGILDIARQQVSKVEINHPDGDTLTIASPGDPSDNFVIQNLPNGREPLSAYAANGIAGSMERLNFVDVRRKEPDNQESSSSVTFTTREGLLITLSLGSGSPAWASFSFAPVGQDDNGVATSSADAYTMRLQDWEFALPEQRADQLRKRLEDLLKPVN